MGGKFIMNIKILCPVCGHKHNTTVDVVSKHEYDIMENKLRNHINLLRNTIWKYEKVKRMERYKIKYRNENEIVFASTDDMESFFEAVSNGSWAIIENTHDNIVHGELFGPDTSAEIKAGKIRIRSEETL